MATVSAEFTADFSQFTRAAAGASQSAEQFSQAWSTAAGVLGAFGIEATASGLINLGKAILSDADALVRLHDQTGISIDNLQRLGDAAEVSGNTMNEVTGAIAKMQENIGSGNKAALAALEQLKVPLADIRNQAPEEQFYAIGEAIAGVEDPALQVALVMDLMGKQGLRVLPMLKQGFEGVRDGAVSMSTETVKALNDVDNAYKQAASTFKGQAAELIKFMFLGWSEASREAKNYSVQVAGVKAPVLATGDALKSLTIDTTQQANIERTLTETMNEGAKVRAEALRYEKEARESLRDFQESAAKRQFEIETQQQKDALAHAQVVNNAVLAELAARQQLQTNYGTTATAADTLREKLDVLHKSQQAGISITAQETVLYKEYSDTLLKEAQAADEATQAFWKARDAVKAKGDEVEIATKKTGVYMNQLHALVTDPSLRGFFGEGQGGFTGQQGLVARSLYGFGKNMTPEMAAAMASGQFINLALSREHAFGTYQPPMVNNTFNVNGTAQDVARTIANQIMGTMKSGGKMASS